MPEAEQPSFEDFWPKVEAFAETLPPHQKKFLIAMLWLARVATAEEEALTREFEKSFTAEQASLLMDYHSGSKGVHSVPHFIRSHFIR